MTFTEWFLQETAKDEDNILPPPLEPQLALNFLREYIKGFVLRRLGLRKKVGKQVQQTVRL